MQLEAPGAVSREDHFITSILSAMEKDTLLYLHFSCQQVKQGIIFHLFIHDIPARLT